MLTPQSASRIGVTYAVVERGSLAGEVRTVGLVTYDETRVKTIAPKVDGYVEQLFVAFTGQPVEVERLAAAHLFAGARDRAGGIAPRAEARGRRRERQPGRGAQRRGVARRARRRRLEYWDIPDDDIARVERTGRGAEDTHAALAAAGRRRAEERVRRAAHPAGRRGLSGGRSARGVARGRSVRARPRRRFASARRSAPSSPRCRDGRARAGSCTSRRRSSPETRTAKVRVALSERRPRAQARHVRDDSRFAATRAAAC